MKLRTLATLSGAVLLAYAAPTAAQVDQLPPAELVTQALDQHPAVMAAEARYQSAQAQSQMLRVGPQEVEISSSASRRTINGEGRYGEFDVSVSRPFRMPGKARLDKQAGALGVKAAEAEVAEARLETAQLFGKLWVDWLTADALVQNDLAMISNVRRASRAVDRRAELRDASALEVDQAAAALAVAEAQLAESEAMLAAAKLGLKAQFPLLALPPQAPALVVDANLVTDAEALRQQILDTNPTLASARAEAQRYAVLAQRARADRVADPSFGVRLFSERGGEEKGAGVTASIPLGGRYRARAADEASATARAAEFQLSALDRALMAERDANISQAQMLLSVWGNMKRAVEYSASVSERTSRGHVLGAIDLADQLYARRILQESQRAEIKARSEAALAILRLQIDAQRLWGVAR